MEASDFCTVGIEDCHDNGTCRRQVEAHCLTREALQRRRGVLVYRLARFRSELVGTFHIDAVQICGIHTFVRGNQRSLFKHGHKLLAIALGGTRIGFEFLGVEFGFLVPGFNLFAFQVLHGNLGAAERHLVGFAIAYVGDFKRLVHCSAEHGLGLFNIVTLEAYTIDSRNHVTRL